ncbi:BadF/BadG/BcrA/BcrD ATPase family protein [Pseudocolwellia sp. HL-MZ7]|uniref:BadF/BadG/BcrA/BcrD ATPase family protein n=1 Tax=Pseudocolwellia sp. HL-MZ7 TaxID=3400627 RepID=UPI003CF186D5
MNNHQKYFIGIDGGGTKCKARLEDAQGNLLAEAFAGPANAAGDLDGSIHSILEATDKVISESGIANLTPQNVNAGIGLAGLNIPEVMTEFKAKSLPFANTNITTDLYIACLGAHQIDDGAIVIIGTGSSGVAIKGKQQFELGGHGFAVGDKASGAWLGKMAVTYTLEALDGIKNRDKFTDEVMAFFGCSTAHQLVTLTLAAKPHFFATLAPLVFSLAKQEEPYAKILVEDAADYINKLSNQLFKLKPARFSLIGGLTDIITPYLDLELREKIQNPLGSPEQGAILYSKY